MKHLITLLSVLAMQLLTGCFQASIVVHVKHDGSGTVEQTITMSDATVEQFKAMAGGDNKQKGPHEIDEAKLKAQAKKMGDGVTFVSAKPIKAGGKQGFTATFAFEDIEDLKVSQAPDMGDGGAGADAPKSEITFEFEEGDNAPSTLTIHIPENKQKGSAGPDAGGDEALAMMQQILKDMRVTVAVNVQGAIQKTNASHREGATVTLLDLEFSKVLADPVKLKALSKTKDPTTDEAKALLKTIPGMKVETENPVTVQFK